MADDEVSTRRFVYAGRRLTVKGQLVHAWLPEELAFEGYEEEALRLFPKAKGAVIGGVYTIEASDTTYQPSSVSYTGDRTDDATRLRMEAVDRIDGTHHAGKALERNHARQSEIKELCAPLRELVGRQVGWANRAALIQFITSEITRG
jgi:hypothetical protein